ncbi:MAG: hypothetical protein ACFE8N_01215 [Promethearchaeota archaeon]
MEIRRILFIFSLVLVVVGLVMIFGGINNPGELVLVGFVLSMVGIVGILGIAVSGVLKH